MESNATVTQASTDQAPAYATNRHQTHGVEEQAACLGSCRQIYEQVTPGQFEGRVEAVHFRGVMLYREKASQSIHQMGMIRPECHVLNVPVSMDGEGRFCGHALTPETLISIGGGDEFDCRTPRNIDYVGVSVPSELLMQFAQEIEQVEIGAELSRVSAIEGKEAPVDEFRRLITTLLESLSVTPTTLQYAALQQGIEHALLSATARIIARPGNWLLSAEAPTARHRIVARAKDYMHAHPDEPITVEELCRALGISRRTLQYSFQEVLQTNPVNYLRVLRLNGARRMLRSGHPGARSVQDVAAYWGFWHLGHFATYYRQLFGELPSQTRQRRLQDSGIA